MRTYLPLVALPALLFSCKPKENSGPDASAVAGTYIGTTNSRYRVETGSAGTHSDTGVYADTLIITAITPDSFRVASNRWPYDSPALRYDGTDSFFNSQGTAQWNDQLEEITVRFNTTTHSVVVNRHHVSMQSWFSQSWDDFSGVRQ